MSNNRHDKLDAARRLLSRGSSSGASPSKSPDCIFFENDKSSIESSRNTPIFTAPNSLAASCHPVLADLPALPLWNPVCPDHPQNGQRAKKVTATEELTQLLRKLPPPSRRSNHHIDELAPFQDITVPFPRRRSSFISTITTDATYSHRCSCTSETSCNEEALINTVPLPSQCDKNGHCIRHVGIRLYNKNSTGAFSKMLDFCPLCMIKKSSHKADRAKPITSKAKYPSYDEGWDTPSDSSIPVQAEKSRLPPSKERSKKSGSIRSVSSIHPSRGQSRSSSRGKPRSLSRNNPRSSSRDKYSLVKTSLANGHRRDKSHSSSPSHGYIIDDRSHYGEMATKSTCSSSYLSEEMSNDLVSNVDEYVAEFERQVEFNRKQSTGTSHSKQSSSSTGHAHRKSRSTIPSPNLKYGKDGCCKNHPSQILAVMKPLKGLCIVQDACPLCMNEVSMDLIVRRRSNASSIPSLFGD
jgi:hypothetical protein